MNTAYLSPSRVSHDARFWLWWVGMTTLGWFVGWWVGFAVASGMMNSPLAVISMAILYMLTSAAVGLMQWWVLSVQYPAPTDRWRWWAPAGIVGIGLPLVLYTLIWGDAPYDLRWLPAVALGGALTGVLQQRILRRRVAHPWWWVLASAAGWALAMASQFMFDRLLSFEVIGQYTYFLNSALQGLILALITGSVLAWLLDQPAQPASLPAEPRSSHVPHSVRFWLWWVTMTTWGWLTGWWIGLALSSLSSGTTLLVCYSAGVGLMQWMLLGVTYAAPAHRWRWWVPASIAGMAVPLMAYTLIWGDMSVDLRFDLRGLLAIALGGALVGVLQQRILRRVCARSWWWVPACMAGWVLVPLVVFVLSTVASPPVLLAYGPMGLGLIQGLTLGLITGSALAWLLRHVTQPAAAPVWSPSWAALIGAGVIALLPTLVLVLQPGP